MTTMSEPWIGLMVALGSGLLVGIERERRKGQGPARRAAGMRSFTLVTVAGALAQVIGNAQLVAAGAIGVAVLAALAYWRTSKSGADDPGLTTEVALLVAYLVGVHCVREPALGAACGAVLAGLLAARDNMHRFATEWLREVELRDALVLAAVALVIVPLAPTTPLPWLGGLAPRTAAMLILVILALQAAAHVAQRLLGPRYALALSGLLGGFVSSTATIATFGGQARHAASPLEVRGLAGAAAFSGAATWLQALALCAVASPSLWPVLVVPAGAGLIAAGLGAWAVGWHAASAARPAEAAPERRPLRLREALVVAALLLAVAAVVAWAQAQWGSSGLWIGTALTAMADAHSPIAAVMALHHSGKVNTAHALQVVLLAVSVNTASRCVVAGLAGGVRYAVWVGTVLVTSVAAAWIAGTLAA
jgi:uncharacterized membrane protein (DUF4010 family)